jgi:isopentenyldiphosphate isomerase
MSASDERVDVIDEQGRTIGVVTRKEMRSRRLPHRCTYVLVFNQSGELFVHLRTATKDVYPSHWDVTIGGVLAAGETYDQGVRREVAEELGIDAVCEELFPFHYADERTIVQGMVYRLIHEGPFHLQAEEIVRGEFTPLTDVLERIDRESFCPDGVRVLQEYRERLSELSPCTRAE